LDLVGGSFKENYGRVAVKLQSGVFANQFYSALEIARSVYELYIDMHWDCTTGDVAVLEDVLRKSRVSIVRLDLRQFRMSITRNLLTSPNEVIFRIADLPNMKALHILPSKELFKILGSAQKNRLMPVR
jgi:hypothetical protein